MSKKDILEDMVISSDKFIIIRCDGKGFGKLIKKAGFRQPYDKEFHKTMMKIAGEILEKLFGSTGAAYLFSDEISFIIPKTFDIYNRRVGKLLSTAAGMTSGEASFKFNEFGMSPVAFDSKIFAFDSINEILEYLDERKNSCFRNFVFTCLRDYLKKHGKSFGQIAKETNGMSTRSQIEYLMGKDVDIYRLPHWQREGEIIYFEPYKKKVKQGAFGSRKAFLVDRRRLKARKAFRFNIDDKLAVKQIINSMYVEGGK